MKKAANQPVQKEAVVLPTRESVEHNKRLEELNKLRVTSATELPPIKAVISIDGIPVFELGDIGAVKAKQKAGKTTLLKTICAALMKGEQFRLKSELPEAMVIWLDTEQKLVDVKQIVTDVKQMTGLDDDYINSHLRVYTVRTLSHKTLLCDTEKIIIGYSPDVVIIDGVVDFVQSFNDESMSHILINELIRLSDNHNCAVICVLHENKSGDDHNMRGHLGTMLAQKSGTVLQCSKDKDGVITVSCSDSRHRAMPDWKIRYDEYGHIVSADNYGGRQATEYQRRVELVRNTIQENGGEIARKELTEKLIAELNLNRSTVSNFISSLLKTMLCEENGKVKISPEQELPFEC